jgi:hypothetical protein
LNGIVQERLASIFRLHGAVDMEPPLLMPVMDSEDEKHQATFIDRQGDVVTLPDNILVPFARLAARGNIKRIKRYHITDVFRPRYVLFGVPDLECGADDFWFVVPLQAIHKFKRQLFLISSHQTFCLALLQPVQRSLRWQTTA